ncbi:MAG TPA: zf-HC2 domain-containing protein [Kofleriaceae bacterium]|jgi:anti-sigma factor RsiW
MSLCESIDTLSMAFLDDELAGEERRELELHLIDCAACRAHVDGERADLDLVRSALVAPPASDVFKARLSRALDAEDSAARRGGWRHWALPGGAIAAAAAAIAVFALGVPGGAHHHEPGAAAVEAMRQQAHQKPLEVQGASTVSWMQDHFAPVALPIFEGANATLLGGRLTAVNGHDAAVLAYSLDEGGARVRVAAIVILNEEAAALAGGDEFGVGQRTLHAMEHDGQSVVSYFDETTRVGYLFVADRVSANQLVQLVTATDLINRVDSTTLR